MSLPASARRLNCSTWNIPCCLLAGALTIIGCHRTFFSARGYVESDGPAFGRWSATPEGCSRDPKDGLPDAQTRTLATFFWENPADHNVMLRDNHTEHPPDAPEQLNLLRAPGGGYNVRLKTYRTGGSLLTPADCSILQLELNEQGPGFPGGRSSLGGAVNLECNANGSTVTAHFTFDRCDY